MAACASPGFGSATTWTTTGNGNIDEGFAQISCFLPNNLVRPVLDWVCVVTCATTASPMRRRQSERLRTAGRCTAERLQRVHLLGGVQATRPTARRRRQRLQRSNAATERPLKPFQPTTASRAQRHGVRLGLLRLLRLVHVTRQLVAHALSQALEYRGRDQRTGADRLNRTRRQTTR